MFFIIYFFIFNCFYINKGKNIIKIINLMEKVYIKMDIRIMKKTLLIFNS